MKKKYRLVFLRCELKCKSEWFELMSTWELVKAKSHCCDIAILVLTMWTDGHHVSACPNRTCFRDDYWDTQVNETIVVMTIGTLK